MKTILTLAVVALTSSSALAADPTLSDIAACNDAAAAKTGASALPHPGRRGPETAARVPDGGQQPRELPAHGGIPVAGAPAPGVTRPSDRSATPGEKTDPSGSVITQSPDPLVKGMDALKADDPVYRAAYRDCMRSRIGR
jgi:hypothetical protein